MLSAYNPNEIEPRWQQAWEAAGLYRAGEASDARPKFYCLDFFPYPSGEGLHVGHCRNYLPTDVLSRYQRMRGYNVLHPMGWDAFGEPTEQFAILHKVHPRQTTDRNTANFRRQFTLIGASYDWTRQIDSSQPEYYRWTQWFFLLLYRRGLAYRDTNWQWWCPTCQTTLSSHETAGGVCWRGHRGVVRRAIPAWYFKITAYAEELLAGLEEIDWPEPVKAMQRNWIGRSQGAEIHFPLIPERAAPITVFTSRPDTLFGVTYLALAPEHPLAGAIATPERRPEVQAYIAAAARRGELERAMQPSEKSGVFSGAYARHPLSGEPIPVWLADYVLPGYGSGAVMGVPAHDERDLAFARRHGLAVRAVVLPEADSGFASDAPSSDAPSSVASSSVASSSVASSSDAPSSDASSSDASSSDASSSDASSSVASSSVASSSVASSSDASSSDAYTGAGWLVDSGPYSELPSAAGGEMMVAELAARRLGGASIQYHLRDWLISRQRYWGTPIPIVHCPACGMLPVPEEQLPVLLPPMSDFAPDGSGRSPLARLPEFVNTACPGCGGPARRETDTLGGFACSSWYFLRFASPHYHQGPFDPAAVRYWLPVDLYVGGAEHAVLHLLYARFWTRVLHDAGLLPFREPFPRLLNQGQLMGPDGQRMSKSRGNVITPDSMVAAFGADALRVYELFLAPFEQDVNWSAEGLSGARRFLNRLWNLYRESWQELETLDPGSVEAELERLCHRTIRRVSERLEAFRFNTAVAILMEFCNALAERRRAGNWRTASFRRALESLLHLLAPIAPHLAEELWQQTGLASRDGRAASIHQQPWPTWQAELAQDQLLQLPVQVNGRLREVLAVSPEAEAVEIEALALASPKVRQHLKGKPVKARVYVPGKVLNILT